MWETLIVAAIVCAAAGYAVYKVFARPSCGCHSGGSSGGSGCASGSKNGGCGCSGKTHTTLASSVPGQGCCGGGSSCSCGK